jgi:transposase-like protein
MDSLKTHYPHLNVESESRKMDAWLSTRRGKLKTRRFVVNWLNRIDAPISAGSLALATSEHDF